MTLATTPTPKPIPVFTIAFEMHRSVCVEGRHWDGQPSAAYLIETAGIPFALLSWRPVLRTSPTMTSPPSRRPISSRPLLLLPSPLALTFLAMMSSDATFSFGCCGFCCCAAIVMVAKSTVERYSICVYVTIPLRRF